MTVERPDRTRVTHRVVDLKRHGDTVELTLKGDANPDPDPFPVTVGHVLLVIARVPGIGRLMGWLASAQGGFLMGVVVATVFTRLAPRRHSSDR